ncbi:iron-uptake system-binding protein [Heyndrickxia sporothermodurans]|nr:iron-uptake system-binding protein [Heyndrickxia sporothermodurans]
MKNKLFMTVLIAITMIIAVACSGGGTTKKSSTNEVSSETKDKKDTRTISYLGKDYTIPKQVNKIVIIGAMEAMEDALVLDVKPIGAMTIGGKFPERFSSIVTNAEQVGEKMQPNFETILKLNPDVILASTKFPDEVVQKLDKIGTTIRYSHIATDWEANLKFLGELTGKQKLVSKEIEKYQADLEIAKEKLKGKVDDKKVLAVRLRAGNLFIYPETVFVNPLLYSDLGISGINEVKAAKAQEQISVEKLAEIDPDYLFIQFDDTENANTPNALKDLEKNPILKNMKAFKNKHTFINVIDPLSEGGPAWSRIQFLKEVVDHLTK